MAAIWTLFRKQWADSRWVLLFSAVGLFGMSWLSVFVAMRIEKALKPPEPVAGAPATNVVPLQGRLLGRNYLMLMVTSTAAIDPRSALAAMRPPGGPGGFLRGLGGANFDGSSAAMELSFWNHPFFAMLLSIWAVGRGSLSVAGELDRGTMDIALSRPVPRWAYLASQIAVAVAGIVVLALALIAGNLIAARYHVVSDPPGFETLLRPGFNFVMLGVAIYSYSLLLSSVDVVRWRPTLIASVLTLSMYIFNIVAHLPTLEGWLWMENLSVFTAYDPVGSVTKPATLWTHAEILGGVAGGLGLLAFGLFGRRDLPANS